MGKNVIEMLLERKQCFEKRCKGTYYFANFQTIWEFFSKFGFAECTFARKNHNTFGFLLAYSYLCTQNKEVMEIKKAEFTLSAPRESMCPKDTKPEYAFIGRSNVGKSSLINMLTNNKKLAKTSKKEIQKLEQMINGYILQREQLVNVFLLVDVRLEPQKVDLDFIQWMGASSVPFAIVFTKADKISAGKVNQNVEAYKKVLSETWEELPPIFITSSEKKQGREEILDYIEKINKELKG